MTERDECVANADVHHVVDDVYDAWLRIRRSLNHEKVSAATTRRIQKGSLNLGLFKLLFGSLMVFLVIFGGCKENPTSVGWQLISTDTPRLWINKEYASSYSTVPSKIITSSSDRLLLGKYPGYSAIALVRFTGLPAGLLDTANITDAYIDLHPVYRFGDVQPPFAFSFLGYQVIANSDSASYDSLITRPSDYYLSNPILAYQSTVLDDTTTIRCSISAAVVHSWFTTDSSALNYGVIFLPNYVSAIEGFASFGSVTSSYWPTLVIHYLHSNGVSDTATYSSGVSRFVANTDQASLVSSDPQSMFVQSGVAYRAQLEFNLRTLPKAGLILKADLELTLNTLRSNLNSFAADTLYAYFVNKDSTIGALPVQGQTIVSGDSTIYRFAVGDFVRSWANGDTLQRLQFAGLRETSSLDLFALYGTLSPIGVRPRLIYTFVVQ